MTRVVSVLVHRRAAYLARTLEALSRCHGIAGYEVLFHAHTPVDGHVAALVQGWNASPSRFYVTPLDPAAPFDRQDRVAIATRGALDIAFRSADYVIHLEDDVVLAPDALRWFEWACDFYADGAGVFTVAAYSRCETEHLGGLPVDGHETFIPVAWATWRDRWEEMRDRWHERLPGQPWDDHLNQVVRGNRIAVHPLGRSLAQHIGHEGGAPTTEREETPLFVEAAS